MPIPMIPGDTLRLAGQDELALIVTAQSTGNDPRDGFNLHVVNWTGQYENVGTASGAIIDQGPLMGLLSSVYRVLEIPYGEENESANFTESQVVDRILSPSIITAENNTAPQLIDIYFEEGIIYGEGGSAATLVAHIADAELNVDSVTVDLTPLGGDVTELNDRGLEGDSTIGDNRFSTRILVPGLETGNITLNVTATDTWSVSSSGSGSIEVINLGPRLLDFEVLPDTGPRGTQMIINTRAYDGHGVTSVELDLRDVGGQMESFDLVEGVWIGNFTVPNSMVPGRQVLNFVLTDGLGQRTFTSLWHADGANSTMQQIYGPHHISENVMKEISIDVVNSAPTITNPGVLSFERSEGSSTVLLEVAIADVDGVLVARANLGVFTPFTSQDTWQNMYDDGSNGDKTANDGIYTAQMQLRSSIPLGTHEIIVQASDSYGKVSPTSSIAVQLVQEENVFPGPEGSILSTGVMIGLLVVFGIGVAAVLFISVRNKPENLDKEDRFGFK